MHVYSSFFYPVPTNTVVPRRRTLHATPRENEMLWSQTECMPFQDGGDVFSPFPPPLHSLQ